METGLHQEAGLDFAVIVTIKFIYQFCFSSYKACSMFILCLQFLRVILLITSTSTVGQDSSKVSSYSFVFKSMSYSVSA